MMSQTVFVCLGCNLLASPERSDAVTCSTACRVKVHRSGYLKELRKFAESMDVTVPMMQQVDAINRLVPDLAAELRFGRRRKIDNEVRQAVWAAYWKLHNAAD